LPEPEPSAPGVLRGVDPLPTGPEGLVCSSKGCRAGATTDLQWNNPKIHTPDRRKHWLACDEHRDQLRSFLSVRGFLRDVQPLDGGPTA
jgi:hypothetical protein